MTKFIVFMAILSGALISVIEYQKYSQDKKAVNPLEVKKIDSKEKENVAKLLRNPSSTTEESKELEQNIEAKTVESQDVIESTEIVSNAAVGNSNNTALGIVAAPNDDSSLVTNIGMTFYTDMRKSSDYEKTNYAVLDTTFTYRFNDEDALALYLPFSKELSQDFNQNIGDGKLSYTKLGIYKNDIYHFYFRGSYVYPISKDSKVRDEMYFAVELNPTSIFNLEGITRGLSFIYLPRIKRFFHKYEYDRSGENLTQNALIQYFLLNYSFADSWNYQTGLIYSNTQTYKGRMRDPSYLVLNELSYSAGSTVYFLGLQTGGALSKPELGEDTSIQIYDSQTSEVYAGVSFIFWDKGSIKWKRVAYYY